MKKIIIALLAGVILVSFSSCMGVTEDTENISCSEICVRQK